MAPARRRAIPIPPLFGALVLAVVVLLAGCASPAPAAQPIVPPAPSTSPAALAAPTPLPTVAPTRTPVPLDPPELRALWVDAFHDGFKTRTQVDALVDWARAANFNALYVQVRRRGDAYYLSTIEPRTEDEALEAGFDALAYLLERAHAGPQPLQVHAWLATLPVWHKRDVRPADPGHVLNFHGPGVDPAETWLMLRDDGSPWAGQGLQGTYYLDPGHPDAARYTANLYVDLVRRYDVDGVHLDQVRYYEGQGLDRRWGYNSVSVARFNAAAGRHPASVPDPRDPAWMTWRRDQVSALVRRVYLEVKAIRPRVAVSAAVVAWGAGPASEPEWEESAPYGALFQDWRAWAAEGIVDYLMPMNYYRETPTQGAWFDTWVAWQQSNAGRRAAVAGVGAYLNDLDATLAQIGRVRAAGAPGIAFYSYAVPDVDETLPATPEGRESLARRLHALFPRPAPVPAFPWLEQPTGGNLLVDLPGHEGALVTASGPASVTWRADGTGLAGGVDLAPGQYRVTVEAPGLSLSPATRAVEPGRTTVWRPLEGQSPR